MLTTRKLSRELVRLIGDLDSLEQFEGGCLCLGLWDVAHVAGRERYVLEHREVGEEVEALEHHAGLSADVLNGLHVIGKLDTVDGDDAPVVSFESVDAADQRRLA